MARSIVSVSLNWHLVTFSLVVTSLAFLIAFDIPLSAQNYNPGAGNPLFSAQAGGQFDSVNLATGNVLVTIPVRQKIGKIPFSASLVGNYGAYINSSGTKIWQSSAFVNSAITFGLGVPALSTGLVYTSTSTLCDGQPDTILSQFAVVDASGTAHPLPTSFTYDILCSHSYPPPTQVTDGSGYTVDFFGYYNLIQGITYNIYDKSGNYTQSQTGTTLGGGGYVGLTDPDGATMNASTPVPAQGQPTVTTYTDTLGLTALTATTPLYGQFPTQYTYNDASGNPQTYGISSQGYIILTAFGCAGVEEYNSVNAIPLPISISVPGGGTYGFTYEQTPGQSSTYTTGRITSLTLPSGGSISYSYGGGNHGINCTSQVVPTLTRKVYDNYSNTTSTWTYVNSNTTAPNSSGQPQGNYTVTETDPAGDTITHYFSGEYETERQVKDVNLGVLSTTVTCYNGNNSSQSGCVSPSSVPALPITQTDVYSALGSYTSLVETKFNSTYGTATEVRQYDFGATYPPSGTPLADTVITYNTGSTCGTVNQYVSDRPCSVIVNGTSGKASETDYTYNSGGHPTQTKRWVSGSSNYLTSSAAYGANGAAAGVLSSTTDVNGAVTSFSNFTCNGMFPQTTTLPQISGESFQMSSSQAWDCNGAVITSATDANGNLTHYYYNDPLWRRTEIQNPDGGSTSIAYQTGPTTPWTIATTTAVSSSQSETTTATLDGLGRTVQSASTDPNSSNNNLSYVNTVYDSLGRLYSVTNPYFNPSDPTYGLTIYSYDALGRTLQVTNPDSTHRTLTYSGRAAELTDESSIQKAYQWDGLGRLAYVCDGIGAGKQANNATISSCGLDISSASGFKTTYGYDALGNLTSANVSGQSRSFVYDGLSRMTSETYPESGMATRAYDSGSAGDLYSVTKSAPNQTTFCTSTSPPGSCVTTYYQWDALHRLAAISFSDGSLGYNYTYDRTVNWGITLANTKGRLVEQEQGSGPTADASSTYSYDPMGRITDSWSCQADNCGATPKHLGYTFNYLGEIVTTLAANSAYTLTRAYNTIGELTGVTSSVSDTTHPPTLYSGATYNALGELIQATYGDGIVRTNTYDKRGRLLQRRDNPAYYALYLGYTPNGSVNYYNDSTAGDWSFTYDAFNRLASSTDASNGAAYSYSYDQYGNRWMQHLTAGTGNEVDYNFNTTYNHMTGGFVYDAAGNLASDPTCSPACGYWYDDLGQIKSAQGATFTYDGLGQRTEKSLSGTIRDLVYGLDGTPVDEFQGTTPTRHTEGFFTYANGETYFNRTDHLGTVRVRTDYTGAIIWSDGNLPFGDGETNGPYVDFTGFANGFWDSESNADHFGAREYAKTQGRWLSPDPAGLAAVDLTNPQTWNRYAYVTNNPVSLTDPLGLDPGDGGNPDNAPTNTGCGSAGGTNCTGNGEPTTPFTFYSNVWATIDWQKFQFTNSLYARLLWQFGDCHFVLANPCGGSNAANNGFTLGIRAPGQTYKQCLAANSSTYSINDWLPSSWQNGATKFALGNDVSNALFGDANEGTAGLLVGAGVGAAPLGVGTAGTFGRRTASIFNLNLSGTTGPAPTILGKTGAAEVVGWVSGAFELKLAADIGATAAEALNCIGHR